MSQRIKTLKLWSLCATGACLLTACSPEMLSGVLTGLQSYKASSDCPDRDGLNCVVEETLAKIRQQSEAVRAKNYVITGRIWPEDDEQSVEGLSITVPFNQELYSAETNKSGEFQLLLPKGDTYPDYIGALVKGKGFQTQVVNIKGNSHQDGVRIVMAPKASQEAYLEEETLYHLGDGNYGGTINSQFQYPDASGTRKSFSFYLSEAAARQSHLFVSLYTRGYENSGPNQGIFINDQLWATFAESARDGSFSRFSGNMATQGYFRPGQNVITVQSGQNSVGDYDDFEFMNLLLTAPTGQQVASSPPASQSPSQSPGVGGTTSSGAAASPSSPVSVAEPPPVVEGSFITTTCENLEERGYWYNRFSINHESQAFVLHFDSRYRAQAAIIEEDQLEAFTSFERFSGWALFDNQVGRQSVTLPPGTYYLVVRNSTGQNQFSIALNEQASTANARELQTCF